MNVLFNLLSPEDTIDVIKHDQSWHRWWLVAWWHQAIAWDNDELSLMVYVDINPLTLRNLGFQSGTQLNNNQWI